MYPTMYPTMCMSLSNDIDMSQYNQYSDRARKTYELYSVSTLIIHTRHILNWCQCVNTLAFQYLAIVLEFLATK